MYASFILLQAGGEGASSITTFIFMGAIFAVAYFFLIRPQNKQRKKQEEFIKEGIQKGDRVVTISGLHGTVVELSEKTVTLLVDTKTRLTFQRESISQDMTANINKKSSDEKAKS